MIAGMMTLWLVVDIKRRNHDTRRDIDLSNPVQLVDNAMEKWQQVWKDGPTDSYRAFHFISIKMKEAKLAFKEKSNLFRTSPLISPYSFISHSIDE